MDQEWVGSGWYRPDDGSHWTEATGETKWVPCSKLDKHGLMFKNYQEFKGCKQNLRLKDKFDAYNPYKQT